MSDTLDIVETEVAVGVGSGVASGVESDVPRAESVAPGMKTDAAGIRARNLHSTLDEGFAGPEVTPESIVEALLFSSDAPLPGAKIAQVLGVGDAGDVRQHVDSLNDKYAANGAAYRIEAIAKGYQMLSLPVYDRWIGKLHQARADARLSGAALETLAIVAYKQPALRADVEAIRGVAVGDMLNRLREMNLVRIVGRAEEIGRPLLYGTTTKFLEAFGLASLNDLPKIDPQRPDNVPKLKVADES